MEHGIASRRSPELADEALARAAVPEIAEATRNRVMLAGGIGTFVEGYDFVVYGYMAATLGLLFFPAADPSASFLRALAVFGVAFVMRPIGGAIAGHFGDKVGRKNTLAALILLASTATGLIGVLPSYDTIGIVAAVLLVLLRCLQGLSYGGEYSGGASFLVEYAPNKRRGLMASVMTVSSGLGMVFGALLALGLFSALGEDAVSAWAWRIPFLIAFPMGIIGLYIRRRLEDTPAFRELQRTSSVESSPIRAAFREHKKSMLALLGFTMSQGVAFYTLATFMVGYLSTTLNFGATAGLLITSAVMAFYVVCCPIAGLVIDKNRRRPVLLAVCLCWVLFSVPIFALANQGLLGAVLGLAAFAVMLAFASTAVTLLQPELFPPAVRYSGSAVTYNVAQAVFGGSAPFVATLMVEKTNSNIAPAIYLTVISAISLIVVAVAMPESSDRSINATT